MLASSILDLKMKIYHKRQNIFTKTIMLCDVARTVLASLISYFFINLVIYLARTVPIKQAAPQRKEQNAYAYTARR